MDAATGASTGSGKPYLHISGGWIYGNNTAITEDSPFHAPYRVLSTWMLRGYEDSPGTAAARKQTRLYRAELRAQNWPICA